jgi:hypothetical protein
MNTNADHDGFSNFSESVAGTNPFIASQGSSRRAAIAHQLWTGVPANTLSALTCLPTFPNTPDGITSLTRFEAPQVLSDGFGARLRALITPPQTGSYVFSLSAAAAAELRLSPDGNPKNLFKFADILSAQTDISPSVWNQYENQQTSPIFLTAGSSYLLELRYLSSSPLGHCQAAWSGPASPVRKSSPPRHSCPPRSFKKAFPPARSSPTTTTAPVKPR